MPSEQPVMAGFRWQRTAASQTHDPEAGESQQRVRHLHRPGGAAVSRPLSARARRSDPIDTRCEAGRPGTVRVMLTINKLIAQGRGLAGVLLKRAATVELDWDVRSRSRFDATDSAGRTLGVFLPRGTVVRGGDVLVAEDGTLVRAIAAPQPVLVIRPCATHGTPFDLTRAAYHLGNRHVGIELQPDHLKIEPDAVLADMLRSMHLIVTEASAAFEPEGGAYASGGHGHGHGHAHDAAPGEAEGHEHAHEAGHPYDHAHDHAHDHAQAPAPAKAAAQAPDHGHRHGPGCGHDHGHGHGHDHHDH